MEYCATYASQYPCDKIGIKGGAAYGYWTNTNDYDDIDIFYH
jgi:hypothetical protein